MSIIGCFRALRDDDLSALLARPSRIERLLFDDDGTDDWQPAEQGEELDVDKAWQGIHFLLTGEPYDAEGPLAFVVCGGTPIGDVDVGYGPARGFRADEVARIADALRPIGRDELQRRFDADLFRDEGIYPDIWDEPVDECLGYLLAHYEGLRAFVLRAAGERMAMLAWSS